MNIKNIFFAFLGMVLCCAAMARAEITPELIAVMEEAERQHFISVNIRLTEQYDARELYAASRQIVDASERRAYVVNTLKAFSKNQQAHLLSFLENMKREGHVKDIRPLWIGNLVNCRITPEGIQQLSTHKDIARLDYNALRDVLSDGHADTEPGRQPADKLRTPDLAWNVSLVNADQVWEQGYTGEGVVVAVMDTGVNYNHLDIQDNMWEHPDYPNHGYNFVDDNHNTMDYQGHGTHCAGTVAGTGDAGTATGIAPGAAIMALQVLNDDGGGNEADVWAGIQFAVEYGADIMSLSLGWRHGWGPDRAMWRTAMDHALSAGVIASVAAGNIPWIGGQPPPNEIHTPGDVPPPWLHPDQTLEGGISAVVSVGATTDMDQLAEFSCKGPVTWQDVDFFNDYPYNPGMGLIRPDMVAPGANVLSLLHSDNTGYTTKSGTSMATPAVAGAMALMLQKNPDLLPEDLSQILEESAFTTFMEKNNEYGSGRLDAFEAINQSPNMFVRYVDHEIDDSQGNNNGKVNPGETIKLDITLKNRTINQIHAAEAVLSSASPYVNITDSTAVLGDFEAGETITFQQAFSFDVAENIPGNYYIPFAVHCYSSEDPEDIWTSHFNEMAHAPFLEFSHFAVAEENSKEGQPALVLPVGETALLQAELTNTGQLGVSDIEAMLSADQAWLTILTHEPVPVDTLAPGDTEILQFEVAAFSEVPYGTKTSLGFHAGTEIYAFDQEEEIYIGQPPTYTEGEIPSTYKVNVTTESQAMEPGQLTVNIPEQAEITGVDVYYEMTSQNGALVNVQRSFLKCVSEGGEAEPEVHVVDVDTAGTVQYVRQNLAIANNVTGGGNVNFELHAFRTWGGSGSNTHFVYVPDSTWTVVVHYELPLYDIPFYVKDQFGTPISEATIEVRNEIVQTGTDGYANLMLPKALLLYSAGAERHFPVHQVPFQVTSAEDWIEVQLARWFEALFHISDTYGQEVQGAVIHVNGESTEPGDYLVSQLETGSYAFQVEAEGYHPYDGQFVIEDDDVTVEVILSPDGTDNPYMSDLDIAVYPNPATELIHLAIPASEIQVKDISLLNNTGGVIQTIPVTQGKGTINKTLNIQSLPAGMYFIEVKTNEGTYPLRFIKQ